MKQALTSQLGAIVLTACVSLGLVTAEVGAGDRIDELDQYTFGPITTRALFPGINAGGPGVQQTDWYPVYLWRDPRFGCEGPLFPPFTDDHNLVTNQDPNDLPFLVTHNFNCPVIVSAWAIYDEYEPIAVPRMTNLTGNVPVYFVHSSDVAESEGGMTWGDLQDLVAAGCALEGSAQLREILHGYAEEGTPGGAQVPSFKISLKGNLADGTPFSVHTVGQIVPSNPPGVATVRTYKVKGLEYVDRPAECVQ